MINNTQNRASHMFPFAGGIAGKLGDRFEAKWVAKKLLEVILGDAQSLQFEFVDPQNQGVEFWLSRNGDKKWFQAKKQNSQGNWTLRRLEQEGVLASAFDKLSKSTNDQFFFVSEVTARELDSLTRRAVGSETFDDFQISLPKEENNNYLPTLTRMWETTPEQTWALLRRCSVLTESEHTLDIDIRLLGSRIFCDSPEQIFPLLRDYLENNFNRELSTEVVKNELFSGFLSPRAHLDPTIREKIALATQLYLTSYSPFGLGGESISRNEALETLNLLTDDEAPDIILLTGNAGTGKSGVIREIIIGLEARQTACLAFRADRHLNTNSSTALGENLLDRRENPVTTLESLDADKPAVLFIDQIDAISEVSGRSGAIREVIFELIDFVKRACSVRVVVACRSYDLTNDRALQKLGKAHGVKQIEISPLDWSADIEPLLHQKGIAVNRINPKQRELLTLPLNLALFFEVVKQDDHALKFQSTSDLFERLIRTKERAISERSNHPFALMPPLSELAFAMSSDQMLDAPESVLDSFPNALDLLATENLLCHFDGRISFFHESFFDYVFARTFVHKRREIMDLLGEGEQHLFRRTQVRQILAMYREVGPKPMYQKQIIDLLTHPEVRYHLRDAVARWLGSVDAPTENELDIILALDTPDKHMPPLVRLAIYPQSGWFPILHSRGLLDQWLTSPSEARREDVLNFLRNAVNSFPTDVINLMRKWWQTDPSRTKRVLAWLSWLPNVKPSDELLEFNIDLIRSKAMVIFEGQELFDRHSLSLWIKRNPLAAAKILRVWFENWYEVFPEGHPFENEQTNRLDYHWLGELQKKSSEAFLEAVFPAFIQAIGRINQTWNGKFWQDSTWQLRIGRENLGEGRILSMICNALAKLPPQQAQYYLQQTAPVSHPAVLYLWLETIANAGQELGGLLPSLLPLDYLFSAGLHGATWLSFANAANAALPHLNKHEKGLVEQRILTYWPNLKYAQQIAQDLANGQPEEKPFHSRKTAISYLNWSGFKQWCILKKIDTANLTQETKRKLDQLERKHHGKKIDKPNDFMARVVPPPIGSQRAEFMSDWDWLCAIQAFREDRETTQNNGDRFRHTDSSGLAGILCERTKAEPERFAKLLMILPLVAPKAYFNGILSGLADSTVDETTLLSSIRYTHDLANKPCCEGINKILLKYPKLAEHDDIFTILLWYVKNEPAATQGENDEHRLQERLLDVEYFLRNGGGAWGVYYDRGFAAEALAHVLWEITDHFDDGVECLRQRIDQESVASIRCWLTKPIYSILRHNNQAAANLLKRLVIREQQVDLSPLATYDGTLSLFYILQGTPEIGKEILDLMLSAEDDRFRYLGAYHLFREAYYDEAFAERADSLAQQGETLRKIAAHAARNHLSESAYRTRAEQQLAIFFDDPIKEIRAEAAECFREIREDSIEIYRPLIREFINSRTFGENNFALLWLLNDAKEPVTEEVILAAERIIERTEQDLETGDQPTRHREMHYLDDLLLREYSATESLPEMRKRILDIIDKMVQLELYGADKVIEEYER